MIINKSIVCVLNVCESHYYFIQDYCSVSSLKVRKEWLEFMESSFFLKKINSKSESLSILQELYFDGNQTAQLKQYLSGMKSKSKTFHEIFKTPMHTFLSVVEVVILSFKNYADLLQIFSPAICLMKVTTNSVNNWMNRYRYN